MKDELKDYLNAEKGRKNKISKMIGIDRASFTRWALDEENPNHRNISKKNQVKILKYLIVQKEDDIAKKMKDYFDIKNKNFKRKKRTLKTKIL